MQEATCLLLSLPDELLEAVLLQLEARERARCALISRRFAQLTGESRRLWRKLYVEHEASSPFGGPAAHLMPFLARRGRHVEHLSLRWCWGDTEPLEVADAALTALVGSAALCAPSLRVLDLCLNADEENLHFHGFLEVSQWAAVLRNLEWMRLHWFGHVLFPHLGSLPKLRGLELSTNSNEDPDSDDPNIVFTAACLPSSLEYFWCRWGFWAGRPAVLDAAAGGLRVLHLDSCKVIGLPPAEAAAEGRHLSRLSGLTELVLQGLALGPEAVAALQHLPRLRHLGISCITGVDGGPIELELPLLGHLTRLELCRVAGLAQLPEGLWLLPSLQVLDISHNPQLSLPADAWPAWLPRLEALSCDVGAAVQFSPQLRATARLATLRLVADDEFDCSEAQLAGLQGALLAMPALAVLGINTIIHQVMPVTSVSPWRQRALKWDQELRAALAARPALRIEPSVAMRPFVGSSCFDSVAT